VRQINGLGEQGAPSGSGVILDPDGTILTNAHIVAEALQQRRQGGGGSRAAQPTVHVALQDGRVFEGRVISADRWGPLSPLLLFSYYLHSSTCLVFPPTVCTGNAPGHWQCRHL
jgi:hypothetical protein